MKSSWIKGNWAHLTDAFGECFFSFTSYVMMKLRNNFSSRKYHEYTKMYSFSSIFFCASLYVCNVQTEVRRVALKITHVLL